MAPRLLRANNILGKSIPPLIVLLAVKGYDLVVHETGSYLADVRRLPVVAELYRWHFRLLLAALVYAYGFVYLSPRTHSRPPKNPPPEVLSRTMVYQCDSSGAPATCNRDECEGSWKSARTRHCSDCGICKEMFDHHCPFMDSCITGSRTFKPFVCFLFYTVALVGVAIVPLAPLQLAAVSEVVSATWDLEWMHENWWKNWWSWIGGPVYRYGVGLFLGYRQYYKITPPRPPLFPLPESDPSPFPSLARPMLSAFFVVVGGLFVFLVAIALIVTIILNTRRGLGAVQVERSRRWKLQQRTVVSEEWDARLTLWVPLHEGGGAVVRVDPAVRLFDLGPGTNWRVLMGEKWREWFVPWVPSRPSDFAFNAEVLSGLQQEARDRSV